MKQTIRDFSGRIRVLGPGGVFLPLSDIEQRVINSIGGKEKSKAKSKQDTLKAALKGKCRIRSSWQFDYTRSK